MRRRAILIRILLLFIVCLSACEGQRRTDYIKSVLGFDLVRVKAGSFIMGDDQGDQDVAPAHKVIITRDYYMAITEVTFYLYDAFVIETGARRASDMGFGRGDRPAVDIDWLHAVRFCNWLSKKENLEAAYIINGTQVSWVQGSDGYRLPTEAEWEYAAKGGPNQRPYQYSGSTDPSAVAWYFGNSGMQSHPVAKKAPNTLGIYDMTGNVIELCWDWGGSYNSDAKEELDPIGPEIGNFRIARGGSYISDGNKLRTTFRFGTFLADRSGERGFRVVRNAPNYPHIRIE